MIIYEEKKTYNLYNKQSTTPSIRHACQKEAKIIQGKIKLQAQ
jgi:hypothetical protein